VNIGNENRRNYFNPHNLQKQNCLPNVNNRTQNFIYRLNLTITLRIGIYHFFKSK